MALKRINFNAAADGTALGAGATSGTLGDSGTVAVTGSPTATMTTAAAIRGARGLNVTVPTATDIWTLTLANTANATMSAQVYFRVDSARSPGTASCVILRIRNASANAAIVVLNTSRILIVQNAAGTGLKNFNSNTALPNGDYYVNLIATKGTTTSNGTIKCYLYKASDDTLVDSYVATNVNAGTADMTQAQCGKPVNAGTVNLDIDEFACHDGLTTEIASVSNQLTTPTLTAGTTVEPSTIGGTDGTQDVSWAAVPSAASYNAYHADGLTPAQGDFTLVASGVTSPYTFTGLDAGDHSFGIKAIA